MSADDLTSAQRAAAPLPPLADLSAAALVEIGDRLVARTWQAGLPSWFWGEGVCLLGMLRYAQARQLPVPTAVVDWLRRQRDAGISVEHVNDLAPGAAALIAAAEYPDLAAPADTLAQWLRESSQVTRAANGALEHWPGDVWADTTFMAGVFLGHLGAHHRDPHLLAEFGDQLLAHAAMLQHPDSGLFAHGAHRGEPIWCFWGRGNAWYALSAVEYLELAASAAVAVDAAQVQQIAESLTRQLSTLAALQPQHGVWSVLVDDQRENAGILETSAAAGIGAAMLRAQAVLPDCPPDIVTAGWRAVAGALGYVDAAGELTRVSAGTVLQLVPFGYSVIRDDRIQPWGQGLSLHAVAAALQALNRSASGRPERAVHGVVLAVGEPLIALTPTGGAGLQDADQLIVSVGGAEVNVAVTLARLGVPSRFAGRVGDDPFGRRTLAALNAAGVDTRYVETDMSRPTGLYLKDPVGPVRYYRKGSAAATYSSVPTTALSDVDHVHLTGITVALSEDCRRLVESLLSLDGITVSFDINFRPALWESTAAASVLLEFARRADLVFTGLDEAATLWKVRAPEEIRALLPTVAELVVKDGPRQATAFHGDHRIDVAPTAITVVEPIGAGDAFAAGYLAARRHGEDLGAALRAGHLLAATALTAYGDHAEL